MRKTFRRHPELVTSKISGERTWAYDPISNRVSLGTTEAEPIKALVHEITHWAMCGLLDSRENKRVDRIYTELREKTDVLTFYRISIEERTASYIESLIDE
ncbi:MAG: hypothetical protein WC175_05350 [Candidatus Dojkabacteria bacterium]